MAVPSRPGTYRRACPSCNRGKRDDALAVTVEADGAAVWICHRCGDRGSTRTGRIEGRGRRPEPTTPAPEPTDKTDRARRLVSECRPAQGSPAEAYLAGRGLDLPATAPLLFHPGAWHWPSRSELPCMVGPIVPVGAMDGDPPQAAHLTFIRADGSGKAAVDKPRLYLGPKAGGVVKLTPDEDVTLGLALAEGIETGLTCIMAGFPTWAALDAGNIEAFPVLPGIESLTVLADHDDRGLQAARACARRWHEAGREPRIAAPPDAGTDWNDSLTGGARG